MTTQTLAYASEPTQHRRWFNMVGDRIDEAKAKGYVPVIESGKVVTRQVGRDGTHAMLMEVAKVKRNLDGFFARRKGMGANVKARILRLNPTIEEGALIRGWHPKTNAEVMWIMRDCMGKGRFIRLHGRAAWDKLDPWLIVKQGKREYVHMVGANGLERAVAPSGSEIVQDIMRRKHI